MICEWCGTDGPTVQHHYPIQKQYGGLEIVNICPNCHHRAHATTLIDATQTTTQQEYEDLIEAGANVNAVEVQGESVLFYAIRSKNLELVELLLQNGAKASGASRKTGRTPLAESVAKSTLVIVRRIADEKAGDDFVDRDGNNLLHLAVDADVTSALLKAGVDPDVAELRRHKEEGPVEKNLRRLLQDRLDELGLFIKLFRYLFSPS